VLIDGGRVVSGGLEYAPRGNRINAVCPGRIATLMVTDMIAKDELDTAEAIANQPINRLGEPEEIAATVCGSAARARALSSASPCPSTVGNRPLTPNQLSHNRIPGGRNDHHNLNCRERTATQPDHGCGAGGVESADTRCPHSAVTALPGACGRQVCELGRYGRRAGGLLGHRVLKCHQLTLRLAAQRRSLYCAHFGAGGESPCLFGELGVDEPRVRFGHDFGVDRIGAVGRF
jgi:Enoyl-(Acyl carrier protein) reductase